MQARYTLKNIFNFLMSFLDDKKNFDLNSTDELLTKSTIIKNGSLTENFF